MTTQDRTTQAPEFKDRKAWLIVFGVLGILLGALCALMVLLVVFGMVAAEAMPQSAGVPPMDMRLMMPGLVLYVLLAAWFITMGIGSIQARRWARALVLVSSWIWLICGVMAVVFMLLFMSDIYGSMAAGGQMPPGMARTVQTVTMVFLVGIYLVLPGTAVLFYQSRHVKATCEHRDPHVRWTDKCPLPVLALSLLMAGWAFSMIGALCYGCVFPFFGVLLSGLPGALLLLALMALLGYLAWGLYKLKMEAWWGTLALAVIGTVSAVLTFSRVGLMAMYEQMGFPEQQLQMMRQFAFVQDFNMAAWTSICAAVFVGYLLYLKRYFATPADGTSVATSADWNGVDNGVIE